MSQAASVAQGFPADSTVPSSEEIRKYVESGVLSAAMADGTSWRLEYKPNGHFFINTSRGFNSDGQWQVEDGQLCGALKGRERTCNAVRMHQGVLHYRDVDLLMLHALVQPWPMAWPRQQPDLQAAAARVHAAWSRSLLARLPVAQAAR